ncbi:MAG: lysophospholipid acyltransferase family protein [Paracoccaceae bacterium]|nr:lysophospholipid acyltransferase family protein [Paracoccaceae bacterium]
MSDKHKNSSIKVKKRSSFLDLSIYIFVRYLLGILSILPYRTKISLGGLIYQKIISPLSGNRKRIIDNLKLIFPDLEKRKREELCSQVPNNIGRTLFELLSPNAFSNIAKSAKVSGPGFKILKDAQEQKKPVILVSGHFGNYDVVRVVLNTNQISVGALYKPMSNPYFNTFYERCIKQIAEPLFPRGRAGMGNMMRYLEDGNVVALLIDQYMSHGEPLKFLGHTAYTATSAAKLALKHDALLITFYVVRNDDGINFDLVFESPVKPSTPNEMTQVLNDRLEKQIRKNMGQWLWTHKRWKSPSPIRNKN